MHGLMTIIVVGVPVISVIKDIPKKKKKPSKHFVGIMTRLVTAIILMLMIREHIR